MSEHGNPSPEKGATVASISATELRPGAIGMSPSGNASVTVLEGRHRRLPDIAEDWQRCLAGAPDHQQLFSYAWIASWLKHQTVGDHWTGDSRILLAHDQAGQLVGILPLACRRFGPMRVWMLAGPYEPLRGFVCHASAVSAVCEAFAQKLVSMHVWLQAVRLGPIDTSFPECAQLVARVAARTRRVAAFETPGAIYTADVPTVAEQFQARIKASKSMSRVVTRQRRLEREEGLRIERFANPSGEQLASVLRDCRAVEQRSWLATDPAGQLRFASEGQLSFWQDCRDQDRNGRCQFDAWVAYLGDKPIAFDVVITAGAIRYLYAGQYDKDYSKHGLGWMLYLAYTQEGIERGVRTIDMGTGSIEYKKQIGGSVSDVRRDICVLPGGPLGAVVASLLSSMRVRKLVRRVRQWRRAGLAGLLATLTGRAAAEAPVGEAQMLGVCEMVGIEAFHCAGAASLLSIAV
jgi:CelD/BcsL family acetyltransferase involved in cellulose biosynthesis